MSDPSGEIEPVGVVIVIIVARMISISSFPSVEYDVRRRTIVGIKSNVQTAFRPKASAAYPENVDYQ